jgi:Uma2 family endonuclease
MAVHLNQTEVFYPDSDGQPMADNTLQFQWIVTIEGGLDALFRDNPDVFVAGDLLWYPVRGDNRTRLAPDALVAFGRPKGYRGSYKQWEEGGIAPQVVFEVLSPGNRPAEMRGKRAWYERFGVEEYYEYDPDHGRLSGWLRQGSELVAIGEMEGFVSPRLGVRFGLSGMDLVLVGPDGRRFESYVSQVQGRAEAEERAEQERNRAEQERLRAEQEQRRAQEAEERANRLAARLRELGLTEDTE